VRLLLDTHVVLWWVSGDRKLSKGLRATIASTDNAIAVSAATFWELAIKQQLGRVDVDLTRLQAAVAADGFDEMSVEIAHTLRLQALPDLHRDPFDRLLIAQSIESASRLVTRDAQILAYAGISGFDPLKA
jgi:PIN domain nuclease of toxin-antitoxin system